MSVQQVEHNARPTLVAVPQTSTQGQQSSFSQVTALPQTLPSNPNDPVSLYRAHTNNRHVVQRVLKGNVRRTASNINHKVWCLQRISSAAHWNIAGILNFINRNFSPETANSSEKRHFLGFASFVSRLGPHPFIPALLDVVSVQPPIMMVLEELQHRDLLGFLWGCRMVQFIIYNKNKEIIQILSSLTAAGCVINRGTIVQLISLNM